MAEAWAGIEATEEIAFQIPGKIMKYIERIAEKGILAGFAKPNCNRRLLSSSSAENSLITIQRSGKNISLNYTDIGIEIVFYYQAQFDLNDSMEVSMVMGNASIFDFSSLTDSPTASESPRDNAASSVLRLQNTVFFIVLCPWLLWLM